MSIGSIPPMTSIQHDQTRFDSAEPETVSGVWREDTHPLPVPEVTDEGYLIFRGYTAKPGVMEYHENGVVVRELVPKSTLHADDSLATLRMKPLVLGHPDPGVYPDMVTPENERDLAVGSTGETYKIREDDGRVEMTSVLRDARALAEVQRMRQDGAVLGLSPGYRCDLVMSPGTDPDYGPYDRIQVRRRYNHLAITPSPRGGSGIHFRIDETETPMKNALLQALVLLGMSHTDASEVCEGDESKAFAALGKIQSQREADEKAAKQRQDAEEAEAAKQRQDAEEAAKVARVEARKARRTLDAVAGDLNLENTDDLDDHDLKVKILETVGVEIPKMDGVTPEAAAEIAFRTYKASAARGDEADPVQEAFRFDKARTDSENTPMVDLSEVYA